MYGHVIGEFERGTVVRYQLGVEYAAKPMFTWWGIYAIRNVPLLVLGVGNDEKPYRVVRENISQHETFVVATIRGRCGSAVPMDCT